MKKLFENIRTDGESLRAVLSPSPNSAIGQAVNRGVQMLRFRDRWRYMLVALVLWFIGLAVLPAGMMIHSDTLIVIGCTGLLAGMAMALRLDPAQLEIQVVQTERDTGKLTSEYAIQCQQSTEEHAACLMRALLAETRAAVKNGASLREMSAELVRLEGEFRSTENELTTNMTSQRAIVQKRREELQQMRVKLTAVNKGFKAQFIPTRSRQTARTVLAALQALADAECIEVQIVACLKASRSLAEGAAGLGRNHGTTATPSTSEALAFGDEGPWWIGTPLPPMETLVTDAVNLVQKQMPVIREKVLEANGRGESAENAVKEVVQEIIRGKTPWHLSLQDYANSLNGDTDGFADRVFKEAAELCPCHPIAGLKRFRALLHFTRGGGSSTLAKVIKDRATDSVPVHGNEHIPTELLVFAEERNVVLASLPEAMSCIEAFRSLPREQQELLVTAVEHDEDIFNYHPDKPHDNGHPARLLACALTLGTVTRSGSQEYVFNERQFGKGYRDAEDALRIDERMAAQVEAKVEEIVTRDGFASVVAKLENARQNPGTVVPKEFVADFAAAVTDAIAELNHRANVAAVVK